MSLFFVFFCALFCDHKEIKTKWELLLGTWDTGAFLCLCNNISVRYYHVFAQRYEGIFCSQCSLVPFMKFSGFCSVFVQQSSVCTWRTNVTFCKWRLTAYFLRKLKAIDRNERSVQLMIEQSQLSVFQTQNRPWWCHPLKTDDSAYSSWGEVSQWK